MSAVERTTWQTYWEPRVMRHRLPTGIEEFAIHEVYFEDGAATGCTKDAISPRATSVDELRAQLLALVRSGREEFSLGDRGLPCRREQIERWLPHLDERAIDFEMRAD